MNSGVAYEEKSWVKARMNVTPWDPDAGGYAAMAGDVLTRDGFVVGRITSVEPSGGTAHLLIHPRYLAHISANLPAFMTAEPT